MKKGFLLLATLVVMLLTSLTACVGCKEGDPEKEGISFDTFLVEGTSVYVVVSNTTTEFSFEEEITTKGDTDYVLSLDANRMQPLESKTVQLGVGNNLFYVTELIGGETTNTYYVTIRRRPVYNVTFVATDDETIVENQMVEEDSFAKEPSAVTVIGCDFLAWDYDFTTPITQDVKINAKLKVKQEMSNFIFSANETFCQIKGVIDKTVTEVTIPDYVTDISASAFYKCRNLISVIIGNGVMSIGRNAFYSCRSLTTITIPNGVVTIGENAFYECYNLASITIPSTVVAIGEKAFEACYKLVEVVNKSPHVAVTKGGTDNGGIGLYALAVYNSGDTFVSQLSNDDGYLVYADGQEKILIGYVGKETNLILPTYITQIYKYAFSFNGDLTNVTVPNGTTAIGERAFCSCSSLESVTIPNSVTTIKGYAFSDCKKLTSVTIPDGIIAIENGLFYNCINLTNVTMSNDVKTIGEDAFVCCVKLETVTIPSAVTHIGKNAFASCSSLTSIVMPSSVTDIGENAFSFCTNLTSVFYFGTASDWNKITVGWGNGDLTCTICTTIYYYSETEPADSGNYWRFDTDGKTVIIWKKEN